MRAIVVDKDYGSVTPQELDRVAAAYQAAGIQMELLEYQVEATRQKVRHSCCRLKSFTEQI